MIWESDDVIYCVLCYHIFPDVSRSLSSNVAAVQLGLLRRYLCWYERIYGSSGNNVRVFWRILFNYTPDLRTAFQEMLMLYAPVSEVYELLVNVLQICHGRETLLQASSDHHADEGRSCAGK